jgi:hypothetical protein
MKRSFPILKTLVIVVLLLIGFFTVEGPWRSVDPAPAADDNITQEGGDDVDETPPSAEGDINEP